MRYNLRNKEIFPLPFRYLVPNLFFVFTKSQNIATKYSNIKFFEFSAGYYKRRSVNKRRICLATTAYSNKKRLSKFIHGGPLFGIRTQEMERNRSPSVAIKMVETPLKWSKTLWNGRKPFEMADRFGVMLLSSDFHLELR